MARVYFKDVFYYRVPTVALSWNPLGKRKQDRPKVSWQGTARKRFGNDRSEQDWFEAESGGSMLRAEQRAEEEEYSFPSCSINIEHKIKFRKSFRRKLFYI